jgi:very-short-patch-repair endonuclease
MAGHSSQLPDSEITFVGGLRVTSVARTWRDMSAVLSLGDLVALGDYFIHWRSPLTTIEDLRWIVERMTGRRGVKKARAALELLDARSESPAESRLRVILMLAGLPRPRVNYETVLTETGQAVRLDLAYPEVKFLIEYQGDYHRERGQWRKDMTRRSRLEAQGWYVMELNADDLKDPAELTHRIRTVLARRRREFA